MFLVTDDDSDRKGKSTTGDLIKRLKPLEVKTVALAAAALVS